PLTLRMRQGRAFAVSVLALMLAYRLSPRRVSCSEILLLVGLGLATLVSSGMIVWWAPVAPYYLVLHATAARNKRLNRQPDDVTAIRHQSPAGLAASIVIAIGCLAFPWMDGAPSGANLSSATPVGATNYLVAHPP